MRLIVSDLHYISPTIFVYYTKKQKLVDSGILHTQKYLEWYNNDEEKANK